MQPRAGPRKSFGPPPHPGGVAQKYRLGRSLMEHASRAVSEDLLVHAVGHAQAFCWRSQQPTSSREGPLSGDYFGVVTGWFGRLATK